MRSRDLLGRKVLVSAGGTRENLDPVRFLGNASSGRQGIAIARAAALRGASVTLVAAHVEAPLPSGVQIVSVVSTADLAEAVTTFAADADVVVMAAAPADFTPAQRSASKLKKSGDAGLTLELGQTTDVLKTVSRHRRAGQVIVGFAAETAGSDEELLRLGAEKLARKGCDLLVLNDVSDGAVFGRPANAVTIIGDAGVVLRAAADKNIVAHRIWDAVARLGDLG